MNRPIEFRAWDERNKVMHNDFMFIKSGDEGNDWIIFSSDKHKNYDEYIKNPYFRQQLKIMQFSGLFDKHGKKIFEGDILAWGEDDEIITIELKNGSFGFNDDSECKGGFGLLDGVNNYSKVIGNIYENSDLLDSK